MPKGTGVDASINDVNKVRKHRVWKRSTECQKMTDKENEIKVGSLIQITSSTFVSRIWFMCGKGEGKERIAGYCLWKFVPAF
jgi:hypothetical protein